jgi:hypothetical protein
MGRRTRRLGAKEKRELDRLCRELVFVRDERRCRRCGSTQHPQWSHIYSRRYLSVRWNADNSMVLCAGCHLWWHGNPVDAGRWCEELLGRARLATLNAARYRGGRPDYEEVRLGLEVSLNQLYQPQRGGKQCPTESM